MEDFHTETDRRGKKPTPPGFQTMGWTDRGKYLNANTTRFVFIIKKTFPFLLYFLTTSFVWSFEVNKKSKLIPE